MGGELERSYKVKWVLFFPFNGTLEKNNCPFLFYDHWLFVFVFYLLEIQISNDIKTYFSFNIRQWRNDKKNIVNNGHIGVVRYNGYKENNDKKINPKNILFFSTNQWRYDKMIYSK